MQLVQNIVKISHKKGSFKVNIPIVESKINRNIILSFIIRFATIVVTFLFIPLAIETLSQEEFGIWLVLFSIINWVLIIETAVINYLRNDLILYFVYKDFEGSKRSIASTLSTTILISLFTIICALISYKTNILNYILSLLSINKVGVDKVFLVIIIGYILQMIFKIYNGILLADHKYYVTSYLLLICNLISLIVVFILHELSIHSLLIFAVVQSVIPIIIYAIFTIYGFAKIYSHLIPNIHHLRETNIKLVFKKSGIFFILQFASTLMFTSGNIIIAHYFSTLEVTTYSVMAKYYSIISIIYGIIISPYWSAFSEAYIRQDYIWIKKTMQKLNIYSVGAILTATGMLFTDKIICEMWLGKSFDIPFNLSAAFAIYSVLYVVLSNYNYYTNAIGKFKLTTIISILGCLLFFPLNHVFVKFFRFGITSVVWVSICWCLIMIICCQYEFRKSLINYEAKLD